MLNQASKERIRMLNDELRRTMIGGRVVVTPGIMDITDGFKDAIKNVMTFSDFNSDNDPYNEHDFGAFNCRGRKIFWKIDYYDKDFEGRSPDPSDPAVTCRALTIFLASEY